MTEVQSNQGVGRPLPVPSKEELPPLIARTPLAVLDEALTFLRINPGLFIGLTATVILPLQLLILVLPGSSLRGNRPDRTVDILINSFDQPAAVANGLGSLIFESVGVFVIATMYAQVASSWYSKESMSPRELLGASAKRLPLAVAAWTLTHIVIVIAGLLSMGALGLFFGVIFMLVAPIVGAEGLGLRESVKRSRQLTMAKLGHAGIVYVMVAIAGQVIDISIRIAPTFILGQFDVPIWITGGVFDVIASLIVISFTAAASVVLYLDFRVRREGVDLYMAIGQSFSGRGRRG